MTPTTDREAYILARETAVRNGSPIQTDLNHMEYRSSRFYFNGRRCSVEEAREFFGELYDNEMADLAEAKAQVEVEYEAEVEPEAEVEKEPTPFSPATQLFMELIQAAPPAEQQTEEISIEQLAARATQDDRAFVQEIAARALESLLVQRSHAMTSFEAFISYYGTEIKVSVAAVILNLSPVRIRRMTEEGKLIYSRRNYVMSYGVYAELSHRRDGKKAKS